MMDETTKIGYVLEDDEVVYAEWDLDEVHPDHIFDDVDTLFKSYIQDYVDRIRIYKEKMAQGQEDLTELIGLYAQYLSGEKKPYDNTN